MHSSVASSVQHRSWERHWCCCAQRLLILVSAMITSNRVISDHVSQLISHLRLCYFQLGVVMSNVAMSILTMSFAAGMCVFQLGGYAGYTQV